MGVANVIRVSLVGAAPSGETWSVNPVWQIGGVSTAEDITSEECLAMATAVGGVALPTAVASAMSTGWNLQTTRVEARRWDGTLAAQAEANRSASSAGTGTTAHPFQTSMVVSLRTAGVGPSARGRLFWPATGILINTSSNRVAVSTVDAFRDSFKTYLTSLGAALDVTLTNSPVLSVWSRLHASTLPVNALQIGDVLDVQRRRRDALVETYRNIAFP